MTQESALRAYELQSQEYLENALGLLQQGETAKAGELFWGAFAQAVKAVAARTGRHLATHREVRRYARELARDLADTVLEEAFVRADRLHANFYEAFFDPDELEGYVEPLRIGIHRLLQLAESGESTPSPQPRS